MSYCWINGQYAKISDAQIPLMDRGVLLGDGIFDTLLIKNGQAQGLGFHQKRLHRHAKIIDLDIDQNIIQQMPQIISKLCQLSQIGHASASLRTTITRGMGPRGLAIPAPASPVICMAITALPDDFAPAPQKIMIAKNIRRNEFSITSRVKSLNYLDNVMALHQAQKLGADNAILLNTQNAVACATNANIYAKITLDDAKPPQWVTPPLHDGAMDGFARDALICQKKVIEHSLSPDDLYSADEICLSNSIMGVVGVHEYLGDETFAQKTYDITSLDDLSIDARTA